MFRSSFATLLPLLIVACASGVPAGPVTWTPGQYYLEATISYSSGAGSQRDVHSADLYIDADQSMRLDSHDAVCRDRTAPELERDEAQGIRTFECGELTFVLRPGNNTVRGDLTAVVEQGVSRSVCVLRDAQGNCTQSYSQIETRSVTRRSRLRVSTGN